MSRTAKRGTFSLLGAVFLLTLLYLALPVQAVVEPDKTAEVLCSKSTRDEVVLVACDEMGWFAQLVKSEPLQGAQTDFRDPIF